MKTHTHTHYPLKTPIQFTTKAVSAKKANLFLSTASQCEKHPSGIAQRHTKESLRAATISLHMFRRDSWGDDEKDTRRRSSPRTGLKRNLSEKWGEKKKTRKHCWRLPIVSARFHLQSSLCWSDYADEPCGWLWQHSSPIGLKQKQSLLLFIHE